MSYSEFCSWFVLNLINFADLLPQATQNLLAQTTWNVSTRTTHLCLLILTSVLVTPMTDSGIGFCAQDLDGIFSPFPSPNS